MGCVFVGREHTQAHYLFIKRAFQAGVRPFKASYSMTCAPSNRKRGKINESCYYSWLQKMTRSIHFFFCFFFFPAFIGRSQRSCCFHVCSRQPARRLRTGRTFITNTLAPSVMRLSAAPTSNGNKRKDSQRKKVQRGAFTWRFQKKRRRRKRLTPV